MVFKLYCKDYNGVYRFIKSFETESQAIEHRNKFYLGFLGKIEENETD